MAEEITNKPETEKTERRDLNEAEQEALFALYCKYTGNLSAMGRDKDNKYHRVILSHYANKYDWHNKWLQKVTDDANISRKEWQDKLMAGKLKAITKAVELLEDRTIEGVGKNGEVYKYVKEPDFKEIKTAYEILKIELGEPTSITKNTNIDENPEVKETIEGIRELIKKGQKEKKDVAPTDTKTVPSGGETPSDTTEVSASV